MKSVLNAITKTDDSLVLFVCRCTLGIVILPHGLQKVFGIFGGHGISATIQSFEQWFGIPGFLTVLVILAESIGASLLILGFFGRIMAFSIGAVMIGAIIMVTGKWGFFMNWYSQQRGEGFEFHILALGLVCAIIIGGSGKFSIDSLLNRKLK